MFVQLISFGLCALVINIVSASPFPQQSQNQIKGRQITLKQQKQSQNQLRSSFSNQGYNRPLPNAGFGPEYSDYDDPNFGFNGFRPNTNQGFDSSASSGFGNGNQPQFGGWNRPIRPRPVWGGGNREIVTGGRGSNSFDEDGNQLGSGGTDNQQGLGVGSSRGSDNVGGSGSGGAVQPQTGAQPWTTVRAPVNRIFGEFTVPEIAQCIRSCPSLSQYDPICGSDNITYTNRAKFECAQKCGRAVTEVYRGSCASATTS